MSVDLLDYPGWVETLDKWGLRHLTAALLESTAPLNFIAAQAVYMGEPALDGLFPVGKLRALARMLEDPDATAVFIQQLRQVS